MSEMKTSLEKVHIKNFRSLRDVELLAKAFDSFGRA